MKKPLFILPVFLLLCSTTFAATEQDQNAASFLAGEKIIETSSDYKLDSTITRREMLKVMMNLSGKSIATTCSGKFKDLPSSDWGCKYAEAALANGYISANTNFRPNDSVTNIEALKMVMQARNIPKATKYDWCFEWECIITDWERQYTAWAADYNLLGNGGEFSLDGDIYNEWEYAFRWQVFTIASRTYESYKNNTSYWRLFENEDYSIQYPEFWVYRDWEIDNFISFWNMKNFQWWLDYGVKKTDESFETLTAQQGTQFSDRKVAYQDVVTKAGLKWKMAIITTSEYSDWITKMVFFETKNGNFALYAGAGDTYFETFYKSFQIK